MAGDEVPAGTDEGELLASARAGDGAAFGKLYKRYLGDVRDFCARRVGDPSRAEDLAQDSFVRAFERISSFRVGAAFWPWLSTIARNLCIDELRQRRRTAERASEQVPELPRVGQAVDNTVDHVMALHANEVTRGALRVALGQVNPRERSMIWRRAVEELSWSEIARADGTTVDAARNATWRARSILRDALAHTLGDLRTWVTVLVWWLHGAGRRLRDRTRAPITRLVVLEGQFLLDHAAAVLVALTVFSSSLTGRSLPSSSPRVPVVERVLIASESSDLPPPRVSSKLRASSSGWQNVENRYASSHVDARFRGGGAAPAHATLSLEIRAPDGTPIWQHTTEIKCGDGTTVDGLPERSPIQTYC